MKKFYILLTVIILALISLNIYYYYDKYDQQVQFYKNIQGKQLNNAINNILNTTINFENRINYLLNPSEFNALFNQKTEAVEITRKVGLFFSKYHDLLKSMTIRNHSGDEFIISKDSTHYFKTEFKENPRPDSIENSYKIVFKNNKSFYRVPVQRNNTKFGTIIARIDLETFLNSTFGDYKYSKNLWHWIINNNRDIIYSDFEPSSIRPVNIPIDLTSADTLNATFQKFQRNNRSIEVLSSSKKLRIMNKDLQVVFSRPVKDITQIAIGKTLIVVAITFIVLLLIIATFLFFLRQLKTKNTKLYYSNIRFNSVINSLEQKVYARDKETNKVIFNNDAFKNCQICEEILKQESQKPDSRSKESFTPAVEEIKVDNYWFEKRSALTKWIDGRDVWLNTLIDITTRKSNEKKLEQSEKTFRQIFQRLPLAIFIVNEQEDIKELNDMAASLFEIYDREAAIDKLLDNVIRLEKQTKDAESNNIEDDYKYIYRGRHEHLIVYRKRIPIVYKEQNAYLESFIDITSLEEERKGEALANKAKSEFIANISHEIRSPLNGVIGMADSFLNANLSDELKEQAEYIKKSSDLLLSMINDILDLSKIESGKFSLEEIPFNLREELDFAVNTYNPLAQDKNITLEVDIRDNVPDKVIGDPFRLKQILTNLIANAVKFTQKGKVKIECKLVREQMDMFVILFNIVDSGIGIPKHKLNTIFESFTQADTSTTRKYGGTGLGTTISKQLVEMMGGEIWAESPSELKIDEENPGSKFSFTIDLHSDKGVVKNVDYTGVTKVNELNILVVDNLEPSESQIYKNFRKTGAYVEHLSDAKTIINVLKKQLGKQNKYHIIFIEDKVDYNGFEIAKAIHSEGLAEWFLIVILSSNNQKGNYISCKRLLVDYYIIKPYDPNELTKIISDNFPNLQLPTGSIETEAIDKNINILVAENNAMDQKVVQTLFKNIGYDINLAWNGDEVIHKIKEQDYDIIFMDVRMPYKDGIETTREIRQKGFTKPVIALTGGITEKELNKIKTAGIDDYLAKPLKITNLKNILMKWA